MLTLLHVVAGSAALAAGGAALAIRKGGPLHARVGTIFFASMLVMAGSGAAMAVLAPERGTAAIGLLTFYLAGTGWRAARLRDGVAGAWERASLAAAVALFATLLAFSIQAAASAEGRLDSLPSAAHYPFAVLSGVAALLDLNFLVRGRLKPRQRIARHLWRTCAALVIAAFSFFLGQQDEFPEPLQGLFLWYLPPLAVLGAMLFWLARVRFAAAWNRLPREARAEPAAAAGVRP
jgi:uncharacterized membrane protein